MKDRQANEGTECLTVVTSGDNVREMDEVMGDDDDEDNNDGTVPADVVTGLSMS